MKSPCCNGDTIVKDSRYGDGYQWRRRQCKVCKTQFNTEESICDIANIKKGKPFMNGAGPAEPKKKVRIPAKPRVKRPPKIGVGQPDVIVVAVKPARNRVEDLRMEREISKL